MNKSMRCAVVSLFLVSVFSQIGVGQTLSGRVYEGSKGTEPPTAKALTGVTVRLYGGNEGNQQGTSVIATATTDSEGWYGLSVSGAYDFFNIVQTNLAGYGSEGATSVGGTVKSSNWIQYRYEDIFVTPVTTTGNKFWDKKEGEAPANQPPVAGALMIRIPAIRLSVMSGTWITTVNMMMPPV